MLKQIEDIGNKIFENGLIGSSISVLSLIVFSYVLYKIVERVLTKKKIENYQSILNILRGLLSIVIFFSIFAQFKAFESIARTLIASSGILAIVVGVAAQDTIGNFMSGISIIIFKPFVVGDLIKINNDQLIGFVEEITLRHTIIQTYENNRVIVPNSEVNKATIENANLVDSTKGNYFIVPVAYTTNIDRACEIIEDECQKHPRFIDERTKKQIKEGIKAVSVNCIDFGDNALILRCVVSSEDSFKGFEMLSDLRFSIKKRFDEEGIEIPFNQNYIKKDI